MSDAPHVVLVHGYFTTPAAMLTLVKWFEEQGLRCAVPSLGGLFGTWQTARVHRSGAYLAAYLKTLPPDIRPWVVGHSLGGLIARQAVQIEGVEDRIRGVLTLGTPHRGSFRILLSFLFGIGFLGTAAFDILPSSKTIRTLSHAPWPAGIPLISFASRTDKLCPYGATEPRLPHGSDCRWIEVDNLGHSELVCHRPTFDLLTQRMESVR